MADESIRQTESARSSKCAARMAHSWCTSKAGAAAGSSPARTPRSQRPKTSRPDHLETTNGSDTGNPQARTGGLSLSVMNRLRSITEVPALYGLPVRAAEDALLDAGLLPHRVLPASGVACTDREDVAVVRGQDPRPQARIVHRESGLLLVCALGRRPARRRWRHPVTARSPTSVTHRLQAALKDGVPPPTCWRRGHSGSLAAVPPRSSDRFSFGATAILSGAGAVPGHSNLAAV
jgi:hypothetical protein